MTMSPSGPELTDPRAYVVPRNGLTAFPTKEAQQAFARSIAQWVTTNAAKHKYLRGGVILVDAIPKRCVNTTMHPDHAS
jgi:4-coumarate--CoA ligase